MNIGGRFARPVTRFSFRREKKKSFLKTVAQRAKKVKAVVDTENLIDDTGINILHY